jgi:hypothetical protein
MKPINQTKITKCQTFLLLQTEIFFSGEREKGQTQNKKKQKDRENENKETEKENKETERTEKRRQQRW